jgi:hypothetical protein
MKGITRNKTKVEIFIHTWSVIKRKDPKANPKLTHTQNTSLIERMNNKAVAVTLLVSLYWCLLHQAGI